MKIYSKLLSKIQNNKAKVEKVVGIVSIAVILKYSKINLISTNLSSNFTQRFEQVQNYDEEDIQVINANGKIIKTGSVILIGKKREFNLLEENDQPVILAKSDGNPIPPTNRGPSNFPTPTAGGRPSRPVFVTKFRTAPTVVPGPGLGAAANPGGGAGGGGAAEFDDQCSIPENKKSQKSKLDSDYPFNASKKKQDQCPIYEQNKGGKEELPDSSEYTYNIETKSARESLKRLWKDPNAKKEVLEALAKINNGELLPRNQKPFKGFKTLKELKFNRTRMLIKKGRNGQPDQIVAICVRRDLNGIASEFKKKYK